MSLQQRTEADLLDEIEQLKEQVAYWRSEARIVAEDATVTRLREVFGLTENQARLLATIFAGAGKTVPSHRLADAMPSTRGRWDRDNPDNLVKVVVCKTRKAVGDDVIETVRGTGYRLTPHGISLCEAALAPTN